MKIKHAKLMLQAVISDQKALKYEPSTIIWCSGPIERELGKKKEDLEIKKYIQDYGESPLHNG